MNNVGIWSHIFQNFLFGVDFPNNSQMGMTIRESDTHIVKSCDEFVYTLMWW
jgi:hypothetical protein